MNCLSSGTFDTSCVRRAERINYWEATCSAKLIGIECSTTEEDGLDARFDFYDFGSFTFYVICGQPHMTWRSAETVRKHDKDSVFLMLLVEGEAFVSRRRQGHVLRAGDVMLYDTNTPYMHGFPTPARQIVFDLPGEEFRRRFPGWDLRDALRIGGDTSIGGTIAGSLHEMFASVSERGDSIPEPKLAADLWSTLETTNDLIHGEGDLTSYHLGIVQRMRDYVRSRFDDPSLDTETVARRIGMSSRQLNRILAVNGLSVKKLILKERLDRARSKIERDRAGRVNLTELAYRCGFSSPSQFSKSFRRQFGQAPSEVRTLADVSISQGPA